MQTVNVSSLKNNPSEALRSARNDLVVVMNRDQPDAVMIGLQSGKLLSEPGARAALATALFRDGGLSLARGARMAQMPMADFITHVSRLGIPVITHDAQEQRATWTLWTNGSLRHKRCKPIDRACHRQWTGLASRLVRHSVDSTFSSA